MPAGPAIAVGAAAGSAALGYQQQKKIKKAQKGQKQDLLDLQRQMFENLDPALAAQEGFIKKANKASQEGFQSALDDADRVEAQGTRDVNSYFNQAVGETTGNSASRGLLGSSVAGNMRLGAARSTSRALSDVQVAASKLRTGAALGLGAAKAQSFNRLGDFEAYRANSRNAILSGLWDYVAGQQFHAQSPNLSNIANLAMSTTSFGGGGSGGGASVSPGGSNYNPLFWSA